MAIAFPADHRSLQPILDSDPEAAENRRGTQKERTILKTPEFMTHERIMTGEEYVSYSDYLLLQRERDEAREQANYWKSQYELEKGLYVIELK